MSPEFDKTNQLPLGLELTPPNLEELTVDAFWNQWGSVAGLSQAHFIQMWDVSSRNLGSAHGYHNQTHPREMLWVAMKWCDLLVAQGFNVNRKVVIGGVLYHDEGYHEDHTTQGFASKEDYATALFARDAPLFDYDYEESALVQDAIIATRKGEIPHTPEGLVLVLADLWNIAADYALDFTPKTQAFADETKLKSEAQGKIFDMSGFLAGSIVTLSEYVSCLCDQKVCDVSKFIKPAIKNLRKLLREAAGLDGLSLSEYFIKLNSPIVTNLLGLKLPDSTDAPNYRADV